MKKSIAQYFVLLLFLVICISCKKDDIVNSGDLLELIFPDENNMPPVGDMFSIDTAYIHGDTLIMSIGYSGGCEEHEFAMYVLTENPDLMLYHNANDDACEAYLTSRLYINLTTLRDPKQNSVTFNLRQSPIMSSYYATLTYNY